MAHVNYPVCGVEFCGEWKASKKPNRLSRHKNSGLEIVLISKGEVRWKLEDREVDLCANMLFYTLPWQEHGGVEEMQPSCEISYLCLILARPYGKPQRQFRFHRAFGFTPVEERFISTSLTKCRAQAIPADGDAFWLVTHFFKIMREPAPLQDSRARDTIKLMLARLAQLASSGRNPQLRLDEADRRVREFTHVLARRYAEPWTLQSMSEACRLGRTQFSELLKKHTGDTPVTYLNRIRLRAAQQLLSHSTKSITEIALAIGFNSSQYFATVFKEFTDVNAHTFRLQAAARRERHENKP
jgi:AraC family L-rhamnose operon regulatory protein RhaS